MTILHPEQVPFQESAALETDSSGICMDIDPGNIRWDDRVARGSPDMVQESSHESFGQLSEAKTSFFLTDELATPLLDSLYPKLWLVARKDGSHIDPLHRQCIKGRQIFADEDPKMHLIWTSDKIFVKPIPSCLFSYHFWLYFLCLTTAHRKAHEQSKTESTILHNRALALGFLRSYSYLIRHRSDFTIAQERCLISKDMTWSRWRLFIAHFHEIPDSQVARRYHYGQMRHSRLNHLVRMTLPKERSTFWFYEPLYWSTAPYVKGITASLGFILATISLVLSSMQVSLAAIPGGYGTANVYWIFSVMVQSVIGVSWVLLITIPLAFVIWQLWWGFRHKDGLPA